jgi:hypothetical protein
MKTKIIINLCQNGKGIIAMEQPFFQTLDEDAKNNPIIKNVYYVTTFTNDSPIGINLE